MVQNSAGKIMQKKANTINICYEFSEQHQLGTNVAKFGKKLLQSSTKNCCKNRPGHSCDQFTCYELSEQYQSGYNFLLEMLLNLIEKMVQNSAQNVAK